MQYLVWALCLALNVLTPIESASSAKGGSTSSEEATSTSRCSEFCTYEYNPVCGRLGQKQQTFPNPCAFNAEKCKNPDWQIASSGECKSSSQQQSNCDTICTQDYTPVCGRSGQQQKTFSNRCEFDKEQCKDSSWKLVSAGECKQDSTSRSTCSTICPAVYLPVCGVLERQEKTFGNRCAFDSEKCKNSGWQFKSAGECGSARPPQPFDFGPEPDKTCVSFCTSDYTPVCGKSGREQKTFSNQCALDLERCKNSSWELVGPGECRSSSVKGSERCNTICPQDFKPVCGSLGRKRTTFSNQCEFDNEKCKNPRLKLRHCRPGTVPCPAACTAEYKPVCGVLGIRYEQTFPNECAFNLKKCQNTNWKLVKSEEC